jgi:hypothetical protein
MAMPRDVHSDGRAEQLVERLRADWRGERWDDVVIDDVQLLSPGDEWPPVIRLDYRIGDLPGHWVETWDDETLRTESLEVASGLWLAVVGVHLMNLSEPPPAEQR